MGSKYNSGTQYEPLDHIETDHYHISILFIVYHRCASMLYFGDFHHKKIKNDKISQYFLFKTWISDLKTS